MARIRACDACYKKKIQCSIRQPGSPCNWCRHHGLACTFTRERQTRKDYKFQSSDIQGLFSRVEQLERALAQATSSHQLGSDASYEPVAFAGPSTGDDSPASRPGPSIGHSRELADDENAESSPSLAQTMTPSANAPTRQTLSSRCHLGQSWFYKGTAILSDEGVNIISSRTGEQVTFAKFPLVCRPSDPTLPSALPTIRLRAPSQELCSLPPRDVAERVCNTLFETSFVLAFPVLDRVLFEKTLNMAYEAPSDGPPTPPHILARACVLAALSVSSRFGGSAGAFPSVDGDMCATKAQCLLQHINDDESLVSLQTILMLQRHQTFTGQWQSADTLHSMACRVVCRLGGHIYEPPKHVNSDVSCVERQAHHIRTLFWLSYASDKDISLRSGRPPLLGEDYCDLTPADGNRGLYSSTAEVGENPGAGGPIYDGPDPVPLAPGQPGLSCLKERVCRLLYSARAVKCTGGEHLLHIRQLDAELEVWRSSIPRDLCPKLSIPPRCPFLEGDLGSPHNMLRLNLQLEYHYLVIAIHAPVRRCTANGAESDGIPDDLHSVLHSSTDLSLEASRSTLLILKECITTMVTEGSHHLVFYAAVAAMSLFTNILVHPAGAEILVDAELLDSAANIMRSIPLRAPTHGELEYVQQMMAFVMELARLARCAIAKATKRDNFNQRL